MDSFAEHAYPEHLAHLVRARWEALKPAEELACGGLESLPEPSVVERLISVCYQASLLFEERRPVTFRVALAGPEAFPAMAGPPAGLHRLVFEQARPFDERELQRLAPAATFERSLIGVQLMGDGSLAIWGLVHSGLRWLQEIHGGRRVEQSVPQVLVVAVAGPGRVLVARGTATLAVLANGTISDVPMDVFAAPWLAALFTDLHRSQQAEHGAPSEHRYATLDPLFGRQLGQHVLRRMVSSMRRARHGGTLIVLPSGRARELANDSRYLNVKYPFQDEEPRRRVLSLTVQIMNELASSHNLGDADSQPQVGWEQYEASRGPRMMALDEALFEVAHFLAMLADVDGAVVITDRFEILGFGAEVSGALADLEWVDRSLDVEGARRISERADRFGTRHRSSYRLCQLLHDALVIVVSQDGGVRFVRWHDTRVTYFDQIATGPFEV